MTYYNNDLSRCHSSEIIFNTVMDSLILYPKIELPKIIVGFHYFL